MHKWIFTRYNPLIQIMRWIFVINDNKQLARWISDYKLRSSKYYKYNLMLQQMMVTTAMHHEWCAIKMTSSTQRFHRMYVAVPVYLSPMHFWELYGQRRTWFFGELREISLLSSIGALQMNRNRCCSKPSSDTLRTSQGVQTLALRRSREKHSQNGINRGLVISANKYYEAQWNSVHGPGRNCKTCGWYNSIHAENGQWENIIILWYI